MASTARIHSKIDLTPQTGLLSAAFESSPEGLAVVEDGTILYANPAFAHLFGLPLGDIEGAAVASLLPDALDKERPANTREVRTNRGNGATLVLEVSSSSLTWSERQLRVLALRDLGEHRRIEQEERQESRDREIALRLTHRLAQDLDNLLKVIKVSSDVIAEGLEVGRRPRLHLEEIRAASQRGEALVRQLLAIVPLKAAKTSALHSWSSRAARNVPNRPTVAVPTAPSTGISQWKR